MDQESLISHCALNQISYILLQKKKEIKLHTFYNLPDLQEKQKQLIETKDTIFRDFEDHRTIEKRIQKYLLMADDIGIQCALYLLLILSDDDLKSPMQLAQETIHEQRASLSSQSSMSERRNRQQFSSQQRLLFMKILQQNKKLSVAWFKKFINVLISSIEQVLNDYSSSCNTIRISILLLNNLYHISKSVTKSYTKKKQTYQKLLQFFERERENLTGRELKELEKGLTHFYTQREIFALSKRHNFFLKKKEPAYNQTQPREEEKESRLIRMDSSESFLELLHTEKQYQSLLSNNQLNLSGNQTMEADSNNARQMGSVEFKMLSVDQKYEDKESCSQKFLIAKESNNNSQNMQFNVSIDSELQSQILNLSGRHYSPKTAKQLLSNSTAQVRQQIDGNITMIDENQPSKKNTNPQTYVKYQSLYTQRFQNEANIYQQSKASKQEGTPVDQTFLEFKDSFFIKDRSFYQQRVVDQSREESKVGSSIVYTKTGSPGNKNMKRTLTTVQTQSVHDLPALKKSQLSKIKVKGGFTFDYEEADIPKDLRESVSSSMPGKKMFQSRNLKGNLHYSSLKKHSEDQYQAQSTCCFCLSSSKKGNKRNSDNKKFNIKLTNQNPEQEQAIDKQVDQNQTLKYYTNKPREEESLRSREKGSINASMRCSHDQVKDLCKQCLDFELLQQETQDKLSNCNIF